MGEYHDLYLKSDVLLLADVFENFRKNCPTHYKLNPCHYLTSPGLSWDPMLKMTRIKLDLISDIDQQLFIEKGMRGGISYIAHRHAKAYNKYMINYNSNKESSYVIYLDANNLYGWAMSQPLPYKDFKWLDTKTIKTVEDWITILNRCEKIPNKGLILEVDLEYPQELHDLHNDYPCVAEKLNVVMKCSHLIVNRSKRYTKLATVKLKSLYQP